MKRFIIFTLSLIITGIGAISQPMYPVSFSGQVIDETTGAPVADHVVTAVVMSGGMVQTLDMLTGNNGFYADSVMSFGQGTFNVFTLDCIGEIHSNSGNFDPSNLNFNFDFEICVDSTFSGCIAHYSYEVVPNPMGVPTVYFTDESTGSVDNWYWDFGDGTYSNEQNPIHVYNAIGPFTVCLTISSNDSTCYDSFCLDVNPNGTIDCDNMFWYQTPDNITFTFMGEAMPYPADVYNWDLGDGTTASGQQVTHTYDPAVYDSVMVELTTISVDPGSGDSCMATSTQFIAIGGGSNFCQNSFTYTSSNTYTFAFTGEGSPPAFYYEWDFGDGETGYGQNIEHTYDESISGEVLVTLTTYHNIGGAADTCVAYTEQFIYIGANTGDCENWFTYDQTGDVSFVFTGEAVPPADYYFWDFGDGETGEGQTVEHTYMPGGIASFPVTLTTYHSNPAIGDSCIATSTQQVTLNGGGSDCENLFWFSLVEPYTYQFNGEATPYPAEEYFWDFGDGTTETGQSVAHTFDPALGELFAVTLTTYSYSNTGDTCIATSVQELIINGGNFDCENWFWYVSNDNLTFDFVGESFPVPADSYTWDFGDGSTGSGQTITHTFDPVNGNEFNVTLWTFILDPNTGDSCMAESSQVVWVGGNIPDCDNMFWFNPTGDFTFEFSGEAFPVPANDYIWEFGDGTTATGQTVMHTFDPSMGDVFNVCLTTVSYDPAIDSCVATSCQEVILSGITGKEIYGHIYSDGDPVDYALVGLFGMNNNGSFNYQFTVTEPETGFYSFENLPDGDYYIFASLTPQSGDFYNFFPTYYGDAIFWFDAELIKLGEQTNPYDISLVPITAATSGPAKISGSITMEEGKYGPGDNVMVMLTDQQGNPLRYMSTNESGEFEFDDLGYDTYKITVEMPGVTSEVAVITLNEDNEQVNLAFYINGNNAYLSIDEQPSAFTYTGNIYPNPVKETINLEIILRTDMDINVNIINQLGQNVGTFNEPGLQGKQSLKIPVDRLPEGLYYLQLSNKDGEMIMRKFVK